MSWESTTEGVTITRWDGPFGVASDRFRCLSWKDSEGASAGVMMHPEGRWSVWTSRPDGEHTTGPRELSAFLNGEGPPEPPIKAGDRVTWGRGVDDYEVVAAREVDEAMFLWVYNRSLGFVTRHADDVKRAE